jgi:dihydroorotase
VADIAVFELRDGVFAYKDAWHNKRLGTKKLETVMTVRGGELVYDRDGRGFPEWTTAGSYEVIQ